MPDYEFAAGIDRGQHDHECGKHSGALFSIPMAYEKVAHAVNKEFVELCGNRFGYAEARRGFGNNPVETFLPMTAGDTNAAGIDLPSAPDLSSCTVSMPRP